MMQKLVAILLAVFSLGWAMPAAAEVELSFHSYGGSMFDGRYPHTFILMRGSLDKTGAAVNENYGFTAKEVSAAILRGPVEHDIMVEKADYIRKTKRHFTVKLSDAEYYRIRREVAAWRNAPGKYYDLEKRNCIHFVGAMAKIVGLRVSYPQDMLRKPKKWLNHVAGMNPQLRSK